MAGTQVAAAGLGTSCDEFGTYSRHGEVSIVEGTHWRHMLANFVARSSASDDPDKLRRRARRQRESDAIQTATQQGKVTCRKVTYRKCARMCPWPCRKEFCTQCYSRLCINGCTDQAVAALDIATSSQEPAPPMLRNCGKCKKDIATYKCHTCDGRFCGVCISKYSHCPKFTCIGDCTADHQCDNSSGGEYGNLDQDEQPSSGKGGWPLHVCDSSSGSEGYGNPEHKEPPSSWRNAHTPPRWPQRR